MVRLAGRRRNGLVAMTPSSPGQEQAQAYIPGQDASGMTYRPRRRWRRWGLARRPSGPERLHGDRGGFHIREPPACQGHDRREDNDWASGTAVRPADSGSARARVLLRQASRVGVPAGAVPVVDGRNRAGQIQPVLHQNPGISAGAQETLARRRLTPSPARSRTPNGMTEDGSHEQR